MKYYIVCLTIYKGINVCSQISTIKASSDLEAINTFIGSEHMLHFLKDGYTIGNSIASEIGTAICPSNAESPFVYKLDDNNKVTELFINLTKVTPEFYNVLKEVLLKHCIEDKDKL